MERVVKRSSHKHLCVSEITGISVGGEIRTGGEDEAAEMVRPGFRESGTARFSFSSFWYSSAFSDGKDRNTWVFLPAFGYSVSFVLEPIIFLHYLFCPTLVFVFTCLILSFSTFFNGGVIGEHRAAMIQSHPYS